MYQDSSDGIEEYTSSVTDFVNKCIEDVVPTVTVHTSGRVLRACADQLAGVFTDMFNMSLIESVIVCTTIQS